MRVDLERAAQAAMEAASASSAYVRFDGKEGDLSDVLVDGCVDFRAIVRAVVAAIPESECGNCMCGIEVHCD